MDARTVHSRPSHATANVSAHGSLQAMTCRGDGRALPRVQASGLWNCRGVDQRDYLASPVRVRQWVRGRGGRMPGLVAGLTALQRLTEIAGDRLPTLALAPRDLRIEMPTIRGPTSDRRCDSIHRPSGPSAGRILGHHSPEFTARRYAQVSERRLVAGADLWGTCLRQRAAGWEAGRGSASTCRRNRLPSGARDPGWE